MPTEEVSKHLSLHLPAELRSSVSGQLFLFLCSDVVEKSRGSRLTRSATEYRNGVIRVRDAAAEFRMAIEALPSEIRPLFGGEEEARRLRWAPKLALRIEKDAAQLARRIRTGKGIKSVDANAFAVAERLLLSHWAAFGHVAELKKTGWFVELAAVCGELVGLPIGLARLKEATKHVKYPEK